MQMTVPDEVREPLVEAVRGQLGLPHRSRFSAERAVDTVLAHLEQVGWVSPHGTYYTMGSPLNDTPVYRIRITRDEKP